MKDSSEYCFSGEIQGITKEERNEINLNKIQYIIKKIEDEINSNFKNKSEFYIYTRNSKKSNILNVFVTLLGKTNYNRRNIDITYLIVVPLDDYPCYPPSVFCLTIFNPKLDIFDMRNLQKNLIPEWSSKYTVRDLIIQLPSFTDNIDYQVSNKLFPDVGEYTISSIYYNLNDFFLNPNNKFFRVEILCENSKHNIFLEMYLVITKSNIIFLRPGYNMKKNICYIKHIINIIGIERIRRFLKEGEDFDGYSCFKIVNNQYIDNKYNINLNKEDDKSIFSKTICIDDNNLNIKDINDLINLRKAELRNNFKFFENLMCNDVKDIENIICIKENIIKNKVDDNIFYQIHDLYNKLIEITSNKEDSDFSSYVKKLQIFLDNYDSLKNPRNTKDIGKYEKIKGNYNFGFE